MKLLLFSLLAVILTAVDTIEPSDDLFPLHRMSRSQLSLSSLLVPYPRAGKRFMNSNDRNASILAIPIKRLYVARVGKRSYMYTARVGK